MCPVFAAISLTLGCPPPDTTPPPMPTPTPSPEVDGGEDGGRADAGSPDGGTDGGSPDGGPVDGGLGDGGWRDGGSLDGGDDIDGGVDGGIVLPAPTVQAWCNAAAVRVDVDGAWRLLQVTPTAAGVAVRFANGVDVVGFADSHAGWTSNSTLVSLQTLWALPADVAANVDGVLVRAFDDDGASTEITAASCLPATEADDGDACDAQGLVSACAEGLHCLSTTMTCGAQQPPAVHTVEAYHSHERHMLGVYVVVVDDGDAGVPLGDIEVDFLDDDGDVVVDVFGWPRVLDVDAAWQPAASSFVETRAAFDLGDTPLPLNTTEARVRVATVDGVLSSSTTVTLQLPSVLPPDAPCDVGEAFAHCPSTQVCVDAMPFAQCTAE